MSLYEHSASCLWQIFFITRITIIPGTGLTHEAQFGPSLRWIAHSSACRHDYSIINNSIQSRPHYPSFICSISIKGKIYLREVAQYHRLVLAGKRFPAEYESPFPRGLSCSVQQCLGLQHGLESSPACSYLHHLFKASLGPTSRAIILLSLVKVHLGFTMSNLTQGL